MPKPENVKCPDCGGPMVPRTSKFGKFWGCRNYPQCKGTRDSMGMSKEDRELTGDDGINEVGFQLPRWDRK